MTRTRRKKNKRGYALISVITIAAFGSMLLMGLAQMASQLTNSELLYLAKGRSQRAAEVGASYVVSRFQKLDANELLPEPSKNVKISTLPENVSPGYKIRVRVTRLTEDDLILLRQRDGQLGQQNLLYDEQWDPNRESTPFQPKAALSYFFVVDVTAYQGQLLASSAQITLGPDVSDVPPTQSVPSTRSTGLITNGPVTLGSDLGYLDVMAPGEGFSDAQTMFDGTQSVFKTVVQTNSSVQLSPNTTVYGDLFVNNSTGSGTVAQSTDALVFGRLQTNSVSDGSPTEGFMWTNNADVPNFSTDNVWAMADAFSNNFSDINRVGVNYAQAGGTIATPNTQIQASPVPTPSNAALLPSFPSGDVEQSVSVASGNYHTPTIESPDSGGKLNFNEDGGTTKIFLDSQSTSDVAINIDTSSISNFGAAKDLQIYYPGSKPINIILNGALAGTPELSATIYAPNAVVNTSGYGEFYGAIFAKAANINHVGDLRLDPSAASILSNFSSVSSNTSGGGNSANAIAMIPKVYRLRSWHSVAGAIVPFSDD